MKGDPTAAEITQPNAEDWYGPYWDPWEALGLRCCSYNGALDVAAIKTLEGISASKFNDDIAAEAGIDPLLVEMLQGAFCTRNWCEYGTSPRGCFPIDRHGFHLLIEAWKAYYKLHWGEEYEA